MPAPQLQTNYLTLEPFFIWVLAPHLQTDDPNLQHYYDFEENIKEFSAAFKEMNLPWRWEYVTLDDYKEKIDRIADSANGHIPVVFNLCDGDEVNNTPGISIVRYLEQKNLIYTGARERYYHLTTSKITMKEAFRKANISQSPWIEIHSATQELEGTCDLLGAPLIVKPAVSGGSMGLGVRNVVHTDEELKQVVAELYNGYHGWDYAFGGLVVEKFIPGREFTCFLAGSYDRPQEAMIYQPVERVFNKRLPAHEQFLSFDRLWETYEDERPIAEQANGEYEDLYNYFLPPADMDEKIRKMSWDAFCAVEGTGYTRADIRVHGETGEFFMLEVNAQCGLSDDEDYTSIGAIIRLGGYKFHELVRAILEDALATRISKTAFRQVAG